MGEVRLIMPERTRYEKQCPVCGKDFTCDGMCGKDEKYKIQRRGACFCRGCYIKMLGSLPKGNCNCPSRFGKDANPIFRHSKDRKEKVTFT